MRKRIYRARQNFSNTDILFCFINRLTTTHWACMFSHVTLLLHTVGSNPITSTIQHLTYCSYSTLSQLSTSHTWCTIPCVKFLTPVNHDWYTQQINIITFSYFWRPKAADGMCQCQNTLGNNPLPNCRLENNSQKQNDVHSQVYCLVMLPSDWFSGSTLILKYTR